MKVILEPNEELLLEFRDNDGIQFIVSYNKNGVCIYVDHTDPILGESGSIYRNPLAVSDTLIDKAYLPHFKDDTPTFRWVAQPMDDQLFCDDCDVDVMSIGCWSAEIDGYGASGIRVICDDCYKAQNL